MPFGYGYAGRTVSEAAIYATSGGILGVAQEALLREYADPAIANPFLTGKTSTPPFAMKQLGNWAAPSVLTGIGAGAVGLGLGIEGIARGRIIKSPNGASFALGYGSTALLGGVLNGVFPNSTYANAVAKDPSNPITTKVRITPRTTSQGAAQAVIY